ncbi:hypothetical protein HS088_TW13G01367 [Tripterygium wilfordii]|uniref:FAS1 domain-containing protein n=1 Tax=Tripterygium wilfordii TaxID=458696 RepID=A0A7J7CWT1_TRIWF|nr:uncharacterized protein LOC120012926 [Tripterygium wilfordii]KAF5738468.1 hypothetical protein HS088_TW13G01367 [Tripterygium wilfordii]
MRRGRFLNNSIAFVCILVSVCCLLVLMISVLKLPEASLGSKADRLYQTRKTRTLSKDENLSKFGEIMIQMLPEDLPFTVFVPSEKAFERDLKLQGNDSLVSEKREDTVAILSRILGFSAVPRILSSATLASDKEVSYDSLSGFILYISKDVDGMLVVNGVRSERVDLQKGVFVVHVMDGVIMDAEFQQSVKPDYGED